MVLGPSEARVFVGGNYSSAVVDMMGRGAECVEVRALEPEELPAGLPTGWKVEVWVRKNGATAGARDTVFGKSLPFLFPLVLIFICFRSLQTWGRWVNL